MCTTAGLLRRLASGLTAIVLLASGTSSPSASRQLALQPADFAYEGFRNIRTNGENSTYGQGLTHRYVNQELRFLTIAHPGTLHEFRVTETSFGDLITETTATWNLGGTGALNNFNGIWYEQAKNRFWVTSAEDYTTTNHPARVTTMTLGSNGSISNVRQVRLDVPAKRVYGGCTAVPASLVSALGGPYVCGWGGYASLVNQGGGASIGPTMYAIADPESVANGATLRTKTVLDAAGERGVRKTIPQNYFDGGDPRPNPPTRPTAPPSRSGDWLSPNSDGLGWMVWGDSYYNTGVWIGTTFASVASLCKGSCWYQSSNLAFDGRQFELHLWNGPALGGNRLTRPSTMFELDLPRGNSRVWEGNVPVGNVAGATFDTVSGRLYLLGFPFGPDDYTGRLFSFRVNTGGSLPLPPVDATVSDWSAWTPVGQWSTCRSGSQTRTEERTRTVLTAASNGGGTPALRETRSTARACTSSSAPAGLTGRLVAEGFDRPVLVVQHPLDARVQLVLHQTGRIRLLRDGAIDPTDFLDISAAVSTGTEQGLLSLAFPPDFASSRYVFVSFTDRSGHSVVARFQTLHDTAFRADPASRFDLQWPDGERFVRQPFSSQNGGHIAFGADGYLYVAFGDGGGSDDPLRLAQQPASLLGKMLRLDVQVAASDPRGYRIPATNPFVGRSDVLPEIWAFGLRNPWRWSFDDVARGGTGALIVADAGNDQREEINYEPAGAGGRNYGWPAREGNATNDSDDVLFTGSPLVAPAWEYGRDVGRAIIGGYVYRGSALGPEHEGRYFFADFVDNRVWSVSIDVEPSTGAVQATSLIEHTSALASAAVSPVSFGVDASGELYLVSQRGAVYRIDRADGESRRRTGPAVGVARPR